MTTSDLGLRRSLRGNRSSLTATKMALSTLEKWKQNSKSETKSRVLELDDLKTGSSFIETLRRHEARLLEATGNNHQQQQHQESFVHPDQVSDDDLPGYIGSLLVTVERKIERVSIDDLTFPCTACHNIETDDPLLGCKCAGDEPSCDCCEDSYEARKADCQRSLELAGIKHIDSDDEEEVRMGFGECYIHANFVKMNSSSFIALVDNVHFLHSYTV